MKEAKAAYAAKKAAEKTGASAREYLSISGLIMSWKDRCDAGGCGGRGNAREKDYTAKLSRTTGRSAALGETSDWSATDQLSGAGSPSATIWGSLGWVGA